MTNDTTNAGPVLPELLEHPDYCTPTGWTQREVRAIEAYGLQCWNACDEQVAGPLRERVAELEREKEREESDHTLTIQQRDHAEDIIDKLCDAVLGDDREEWSSGYFFEHAVEDVEEEIDRLRSECEAKDAVIADSRRLAAEIGQALDGAAAAAAPSLCDLIEPVRKLRMQHDMLSAENEAKDAAIAALQADAERWKTLMTMRREFVIEVLSRHPRARMLSSANAPWTFVEEVDAARAAREG